MLYHEFLNINEYRFIQNIIYYLKTHNISVKVTGEAKRKNIIKYNKHYILRNNLLFKELKDRYLKVVKDSEVEPLLYMLYTYPLKGHLGIEKILKKVKRQYYWLQFVEDIKKYIASCDKCQKREKKSRRGEFRPILVGNDVHKTCSIYISDIRYFKICPNIPCSKMS